jgi:carbon monoxide dehydrogenase subunit G
MASVRNDILTSAPPAKVWDAVRDVGAIHTRLLPGFIADARLEGPRVRIVTLGNGMVLREPIITLDDAAMRVVWSNEGGSTTHSNVSLEVVAEPAGGSRVVWIADFLPDEVATAIAANLTRGAAIMKATLDRLAS